ncbi:AlpA family transcriptional regulator [Caulobacter sp. FWC2]|uniref:helix-turn-helix transcriptional regulator n=1 Tax=Caulobacter sp. FWC2 TaxID=69664 RepID=UPI000C1500B8|nr:helix-turn-helix domain-containing protein [Caulobacter sp. FWC2]PIB92709.1 DNA-binding protein [Caulobacter sp. FWC2]
MPDTEFARYVDTREAAHLIGLSPRTLEKYRTFGAGPAYRKIGGRVVYRQADLVAWAEQGARHTTHDPDGNAGARHS